MFNAAHICNNRHTLNDCRPASMLTIDALDILTILARSAWRTLLEERALKIR